MDPVKTETQPRREPKPWLGLAVLIVIPLAIPLNILLWRLALG